MKKILFGLMMLAGITAYAQPKSDLRPNETVLLYADSFDGNVDPVYGEKLRYAKFEMTDDNKLTGPEDVPANGNLGNINKLARIDL